MKIIAYIYSNPLLEATPDPNIWGCEVDCIYQDLDTRENLTHLLKYCQENPGNYLLIRRLEELGNSLEEISTFLAKLESLNMQIITTENDGNIDANMLKFIQQIQSNQHSRSIRQAQARRRLKAMPPPGKICYGYKRGKDKYILDRSAAPVVKDFFEHFLLYGSLRGSVRYLEKKYGKKISVTTGKRWLTNPVYRGNTAYYNGDIISDTHIAIISKEEAAQIDRLLRRNRNLPTRSASANRSLSGLVICGKCQSSMTITSVTARCQPQKYLYLRPINCPQQPQCRSIAYEQVFQQTIVKICEQLPLAVAAMNLPTMNSIKDKLAQAIAHKQEILKQLPNLKEEGILDLETCELRTYRVRVEIAQLEAQMAELPPVNLSSIAQAVSIPRFWLDLSESERRFYFREFIKQIEIVREDSKWQIKLIFIFTNG